MEHYVAALDYRDMIVGIGLDSNEDQRPPMMFQDVFVRARKDGFRLTAHCDVGKTYPVENVRQVLNEIGGNGAERIDHGLNAVEDPALVQEIKEKGLGMTLTPWSYIRHQPMDEVFQRIRVLFDAGIKINIASDDPALMEDTWPLENLLVVKKFCSFSNQEIRKIARDSIEMCWAPQDVKDDMLRELEAIDVSG
jgi:adenosine deaminase